MAPTIEGTKKVALKLRSIHGLREEIAKLETEISNLNRKLAQDRQLMREEVSSLNTMLEAMDLTASGNTGHEGRRTWFLTELYGQIAEEL